MEFLIDLAYSKKEGMASFYSIDLVCEGDVHAEVVLVPGEFIDECVTNHSKLPLMACAIHNSVSSKFFGETSPLSGKNIILVRVDAYRIATKRQYKALLEHEFGHIVHGHTGASYSSHDEQEMLANAFVAHPEALETLGDKWAQYTHRNCDKCKTKTILDRKTIKGFWILYCPSCGEWISSGQLNPLYVDKLIRERLEQQTRELPEELQKLSEKIILSFEENNLIDTAIRLYKN